MNGVTYESKTLTVKPANSNEPNQTPTNNVYVKGLPISFTKQNLEAMFSRFGPILESRILTGMSCLQQPLFSEGHVCTCI